MKNIITIIILIYNILIVSAQTTPTDEKLLEIRAEIQNMVKDSVIPSMAIAVIKEGEIIWQEAIGYANIKQKIPANIHSIYPLGSISKSITGTGMMQMINAGKLDLQDDIHQYIAPIQIKDIEGKTPTIKLWQLLSMNAGLNHGYGVFDDVKSLPQTKEEQTRFFEETTIIAFKPGTTYEYSNRSFYLSEVIIERISGKSFQNYMYDNIFHPLMMENTFAYEYQYRNHQDLVSTYASKDLIELEKNISYPAGGSGFWSSINDMTQYALFHLGNIKDSTIITPVNLNLFHHFRQGPADLFGLGWFNFGNSLYSNGNVGGGNAAISIDKENQLAVICLLNKTSWDGLADQIAGKIKEYFTNKKDTGFEQWQRIYGTPYAPQFELFGTWEGIIKQPVSNIEIPVSLFFDNQGTIKLTILDQVLAISNPTFNLLKELEGSFNTKIPKIYDEETRCGLKLKLENNTLNGYIQYDHNSKHRFYRLPLYIKLKKKMRY